MVSRCTPSALCSHWLGPLGPGTEHSLSLGSMSVEVHSDSTCLPGQLWGDTTYRHEGLRTVCGVGHLGGSVG